MDNTDDSSSGSTDSGIPDSHPLTDSSVEAGCSRSDIRTQGDGNTEMKLENTEEKEGWILRPISSLSKDPEDPVDPEDTGSELEEGGWGWVCVVGAALLSFLSRGLLSCFAIVFKEMRQRFDSSAMETAWVYSIFVTIQMCISPVTSAVCQRWGCRRVAFVGAILVCVGISTTGYATQLWQVYITFGLIAGIGAGTSVGTIALVINMYFDRRRSLATSMSLLINGLGSVAFAPLVTHLFYQYGYQGTLLLLGGILLHGCLSASVFRKPKIRRSKSKAIVAQNGQIDVQDEYVEKQSEKESPAVNCSPEKNIEESAEQTEDKVKCRTMIKNIKSKLSKVTQYSDFGVLKKPRFATYSLMMCAASLCLSMNSVVVAEFFTERQATPEQVALLIVVYGVISIPIRVIFGATCDRTLFRKIRGAIYGFGILLVGFSITLAPLTHTVVQLFVWYLAIGALTASQTSLETVVIADLLGREKLPDGLGLSRFGRGLGILVGPTLGGAIKDACGTYDYTYYSSGSILLLASIIYLVTWFRTLPERECVATDGQTISDTKEPSETVNDKDSASC